jgi:uncharacterized protein YaaN involved in tellurite resistance
VSNPSKSSNPAEPEKAPPGFVSDPSAPSPAEPDGDADEAIDRLALGFVDDILDAEPGSSDLARIVSSLERLGDREFLATAAMSGRLLDRRFRAINAVLLGSRAPMARQLADLRKVAAQIDPGRLKLGGKRSADDEIRELDRYFERFSDAQPRLQSILDQLNEGRFRLEQDNAAIAHEESSLAAQVETLRRYALLAARIDDGLASRLDSLAVTDRARADSIRMDVLTVVRRRRQEVLTQEAIALQGLSALHIVSDNNAEVIRAVASAVFTTSAAIRTAVMTAQAAASQRIALGHVRAANLAASAMADHAAALEAETSGPGGRVALLKQAWSDVYTALDRVEAQKAQALRTIADADRELTRPKPGLSGRR